MVVLVNPNLTVQTSDPFTTGIVYMPIGLAYVAASLRASKITVKVIDAFAQKPRKVKRDAKFIILGLSYEETVNEIPANTSAVFVYAINLANHIATIGIVKAIKNKYPSLPVIILENTQAVTAYSLRYAAKDFYNAGANYILTGEGELRSVSIAKSIYYKKKPCQDGLGSPDFYTPPLNNISNLDGLPFPAWDLFPLENYWNLRFAHGPQKSRKYLPLLTSRGCPYSCKFCVTPSTSKKEWRLRSPKNVVDEIEFLVKKYKVMEFHIEDLNPTVSEERTQKICNEILDRGLNITWKIVSGTKIETIKSEKTIELMAKSGCRYISISPETGSENLLKTMNKSFDLGHAVKMVRRMHSEKIKSQACFVLGFPGETEKDLEMTWSLVKKLTQYGISEIALFIITPVPGSEIYKKLEGYNSLSELTFSPTWRRDYSNLNSFRLRLYFHFLLWKVRWHPLAVLRQVANFLMRKFETKMEMVPYRALVYKWLNLNAK